MIKGWVSNQTCFFSFFLIPLSFFSTYFPFFFPVIYIAFFPFHPSGPYWGSNCCCFWTFSTPLGCLYCCLYELMCFWESDVIEWVTMGGVLVYVHVCACVHDCVSKVNWGLVGKCNFASVYSNTNGPIETPSSTWNNKRALCVCVCVYVWVCLSVCYCTYMCFIACVHIVCVRVCLCDLEEGGCDLK